MRPAGGDDGGAASASTAHSAGRSLAESALFGAATGALSTVGFQPFDRLKTCVQDPGAIGGGARGGRMLPTARHIVATEGVGALWKGLTPSLLRVVPGVAVYFAGVDSLQRLVAACRRDGEPLGPFGHFAVGGAARSAAVLLLMPVTVVKTRVESLSYEYGSMSAACRHIVATSGYAGLFSGLVATVLRDAPYSALYLACYRQQLAWLNGGAAGDEWSPAAARLVCGVTAGAAACALTHPFDMVKTQSQLFPAEFARFWPAAATVYKLYGPLGFYRGFVVRTARRSLIAAFSWTFYDEMRLRAVN